MIITFEAEFELGQIVYHKTDVTQEPYIITEYVVDDRGIQYICSADGNLAKLKPIELSAERNDIIVLQFGD